MAPEEGEMKPWERERGIFRVRVSLGREKGWEGQEPCGRLKAEEGVGGDSKKKGIQGSVSSLKKITKLKP